MKYDDNKKYYELALSSSGIKLQGKNNLYTSLNGHMYSFLGKDGVLAVRLSDEDKKQYDKKFGTGNVVQYGAVMRGYVKVTEDVAKDVSSFSKLLHKSQMYIKTLKPKAGKR